jgi:WhiB family redox-sensing transcriptional regulator
VRYDTTREFDIYGDPPGSWVSRGACRTAGVDFFASHPAGQAQALRVCGLCPVREECLRYASDRAWVHGVWGGLSARARRRTRTA